MKRTVCIVWDLNLVYLAFCTDILSSALSKPTARSSLGSSPICDIQYTCKLANLAWLHRKKVQIPVQARFFPLYILISLPMYTEFKIIFQLIHSVIVPIVGFFLLQFWKFFYQTNENLNRFSLVCLEYWFWNVDTKGDYPGTSSRYMGKILEV